MTTIAEAPLPAIIQGGMGVAVSGWRLAQAVAARGQLGVVSGTAIERVVAYRLQEGDPGGHYQRALAAFPDRAIADQVLDDWCQPDGLPRPGGYRMVPPFSTRRDADLERLAVAAAFAEVLLAKERGGQVGINLLEKIALPNLPVLYGAILAGVDWVLMGAGIPRWVPTALDALAAHRPAVQPMALDGGGTHQLTFDPALILAQPPACQRPRFLAIVASDVLATSLSRSGGVDGFVIEGAAAGGHNAPPRGGACDAHGDPIYGPRDIPDLTRIARLGLPFWLAGGAATRADVDAAKAHGAQGVQVGTAFALCRESGLDPELRRTLIDEAAAGTLRVRTDGRASPTGFPFKVAEVAGSEGVRDAGCRTRRACTLGYLRRWHRRDDGALAWSCPAEPVAHWTAKGGDPADTAGRRCLCHGLLAAAGMAQAWPDGRERPLSTIGDGAAGVAALGDRSADEVLDALLGPVG